MKQLKRIAVKSRWEVADYVAGLEVYHAVVSITGPGDRFADIPRGDRCRGVLRLRFDDVDVEIAGFEPFTPEQALEARDFLEQTDAHLLVCQCDYGISRSAGMAAAVACVHGLDADRFFTQGRYDPNLLVMERMLQAYRFPSLDRVMERCRRLSTGTEW